MPPITPKTTEPTRQTRVANDSTTLEISAKDQVEGQITAEKLNVKDTLDKKGDKARTPAKRLQEPPMPPVKAPVRYEPGPSVQDVAAGAATLKIGDKGISVKQLQEALNAAGATPKLEVDGFFGPKTQAALDAFQKKSGVTEVGDTGHGVAGKQTLDAFVQQIPPEKMEMIQNMELTDKLQTLGYLPAPPHEVTKAELEAAAQKFVTEHKDDLNGVNTVDELFGVLDRLIAEDNGRNNTSGGQWSGNGARRSGRLPPSSTYGDAPSRNQGTLREQAAQNISSNPPPAGSQNARIADATREYMGTSTRRGPDGGNLACAWSVNNILANAGVRKVGSNTNYVPSVEADLKGRRGTQINARDAQPGDIVIWPNGHHIGIAMGNGKVANNSSSRAAFVNMGNIPAGARVYRLNE